MVTGRLVAGRVALALLAAALVAAASPGHASLGASLQTPEGLGSPLAREAAGLAARLDALGLAALLALPSKPGAAAALGAALRLEALRVPGSSAADARALPELPLAGPSPLTGAVLRAYEVYGLAPPDAASLAGMRAQEAALDPGLARPAAALLLALAEHAAVQRAAALAWAAGGGAAPDGVTAATWHADPATRSPDAAPREEELLRAGAERAALLASALRIASSADDLAAALVAAPGPRPANEGGFVFRDAFDLVLVGDAGPNVYRGNRLGQPLLVANGTNLLTVDLGGDDLYLDNAGGALPVPGANGLAAAASIDLAGNDVYAYATELSLHRVPFHLAQGAGVLGGVGLLVDLAGDDRYSALQTFAPAAGARSLADQHAQGSGVVGGVGVLLDAAGHDAYEIAQPFGSAEQDGQGAGLAAGIGVLLDAGGNDLYTVAQDAEDPNVVTQAAQGVGLAGVGLLMDLEGLDGYAATAAHRTRALADQAAQGVGRAGVGVLLDAAGADTYAAAASQATTAGDTVQVAQGVGEAGGLGLLWERGGSDAYLAGAAQDAKGQASTGFASALFLVQGVGASEALGLLLDEEGDDAYAASALQVARDFVFREAQGSAFLAAGLLVDLAGTDTYSGGPGRDGAVWLQGTIGAGIDR